MVCYLCKKQIRISFLQFNVFKVFAGFNKMPTNNVDIIRVPLPPGEGASGRPQVFPKMPRLYLELIENKGKIKQGLRDTEHIPGESDEVMEEVVEEVTKGDEGGYEHMTDEPIDLDVFDEDIDLGEDIDSDVFENRSIGSSISSKNSIAASVDGSIDLDARLDEMIGSDKPPKKNKYSVSRNERGYSVSRKTPPATNTAPSFAELEAKGSFVVGTDDTKRELLFKFELLRKSYPTATIPVFSVHTDYRTMLNSYDDCVRRLSLDSSVENYKQYLIYGFMGVEFVFGKFFKLDMEGFAQQQILSMSSYEKLLIELGEKSYVPDGSKMSVEVRLLGLVIMNAAFFIVSKMILKKTGANVMSAMNGVMGGGAPVKEKVKMKGPSISLDDM